MMTAKLINVEGSKIKIELILELSRSMLDTEINIQKGLNEVGCIASKEALKYLDTDGSPLKIGEEIWKSKGEQPKEYQTPYGEVIVNRHVYQRSVGGKTYCPLEKEARIIITGQWEVLDAGKWRKENRTSDTKECRYVRNWLI